MNNKILTTLEFGRIKAMIAKHLVSAVGHSELDKLEPKTDIATVQQMLTETTDAADIYRIESGIPIPQLADVSPQLKRLRIKADLNATELAQIATVLQTSVAVKHFFDRLHENKVELRTLPKTVEKLVTIPSIAQRLRRSIDPDGRVTDEASTKLHGIRSLISQTETEIRSQMDHYIHGRNAKYLTEPIITMRNDRFVIPVQSRERKRFGGVVHDTSASGETLYIEPGSVVELNNRLRAAQISERAEVRAVLKSLSRMIAPYRNDIANNERILGHLDLLNAKAITAHEMKATLPVLNENNQVNLKKARHPLIPADSVVANNIKLGQNAKTVIISGPNTGGKTITLKTLGIIQLMGQSGMFIPAEEGSTIGVFDNIFADIGDEQSLEQNLSTFSGHMDNVKSILEHATANSLVLLDELGAGTDPKEGAALAMAILDEFGAIGSSVVITTHYPELKVYAYDRPETINASMEFDIDTLRPTYRLMLGVPGQSNGIEIAKRLGISDRVVMEARSLIQDDSQDLNKMIGDLVSQRKQAREQNEKLQKLLRENRATKEKLTTKLARFDEQREKLYEQARSKANHEVSSAKRQANSIIHHLRQMETRSGAHIRENELIDAQGKLNALHKDNPRLNNNSVLRRAKRRHDLHVGDMVLVKSYGQQGKLLSKRGAHEWEVQLGILRMKIDERQLEKVSAKELQEQKKQRAKRPKKAVKTTQTRRTQARLDLRGHRYDEAMHEVEDFIDHALLNNLGTVTIIHGKGTGALRKGTRQYLQSNPRVKSFEYAAPNNGGDGATIVHL